ncbi:MAG TPA: cytochrome C oxidase subunit IV family protein [Kofleriaceae bacterium]|nr:cytochrome C oxidase subunit IV family protein [Kofleriaceae bacterium]
MEAHPETNHGDDHGHGFAHVASVKSLILTWGTLMCLTGLTVYASTIHFGSNSMNLLVAMAIAIVKGTLVIVFFMHMRHEKPFHVIIIAAGILFAVLFVSIGLIDTGQYQDDVVWGSYDPGAQPTTSTTP